MAQNEVRVVITGDASKLGAAFGVAAGHAEGWRTKMATIGASMSNIGRSMSMGLTLPIVGLGVLFGKELGEAGKVIAQTEAVIKSTGGVANVTAGHVSAMAEELMKLSGVDDEAIASGENLLLTFTNIQNRVGEGNDIFDQATRAALDMSVAMGTDMTTASMQIGKALNDPIQGVGALRKVGVQLTDQQENQIKMFMAVGDTASAQKIILGELRTEFEGSAAAAGETAAGKFARLRETLMNVGAEVMEKLLPAFEKLAGWLETAIDWVGGLSSGWQTVVAVAAVVVAAIGPVLTIFGSLVSVLAVISLPVLLVVAAIAALAAAFVYFYTTNQGFHDWVNGVASAVWGALQAAFWWIKDTAIPALVVAFGWLQEKGAEFAAWLQENLGPVVESAGELFAVVSEKIMEVVANLQAFWDEHGEQIMQAWSHVWSTIVDLASNAWNTIRGVIEAAIQIIRGIIQIVTGAISGDWSKVWEGIRNVVGGIWDAIYAVVSGVIGQVSAVISNGAAAARDALLGPFMSMASGVGNAVNGVMDWVSGLPGRIRGALSGAGSWLVDAGRAIMDGLLDGMKAAWEKVKGFVSSVGGMIKNLKGPLDYDAKLLIPEGQAIMAGLGKGLNIGFAEVRHSVSGYAPAMVSAVSSVPVRGAAGVSGGDGVHLHFHGPVSRDSEAWLLDVLARANRSGASAIPGVR